MDRDYPHFLAHEADELLETTLTQDDRERLQEIYRDINGEIRWSQVIDNAFPVLLEMAEELVQVGGMCKNGDPWHMVLEEDVSLFLDEDPKAMARRHSLILMLAKKLLGGLKTRVNQTANDIQVLSQEEEDELVAIAWSEVDQEPEVEEPVARPEVVAEVEIAPAGDCLKGGNHIRTTVRWKRKNGEMFSETYCKDCRKVVRTVHTQIDRPSERVCQHPGAEWVEGEEGKKAVCTACKGDIPNPETYHWVDSGLEPFGDDPSKDEAITLCSDY